MKKQLRATDTSSVTLTSEEAVAGVAVHPGTPHAAANSDDPPAKTVPLRDADALAATMGVDHASKTSAVGVATAPPAAASTTNLQAVSSSTSALQFNPIAGVVVPRATPLVIENTPSTREAFISKLAKHTTCILAAPSTVRRSTETLPAGQTPRLEGAQVEFSASEVDRRSKKKAMWVLDIIGEHEGITQKAQEYYSNLFGHPISDVHLEGLAALFNWSIPDFSDQEGEEVLAS